MISDARLTDSELKVLAAFQAGNADINVDRAKVRGDFLRGLFLGDYHEKADYRGTRIVGAIISDEFNMEFCETKFPMRFFNCQFEKAIKFQQLACPELDLSGCNFKRSFDARMVKVAGSVNLIRVISIAPVSLANANIGGQLDCSDGSFQNKGKIALVVQSAKVTADVFLCGGFKADGMVSLAGADIGGQLNCSGGSFRNKDKESCALNAQLIKATDVFLREGFNAEGAVSLSKADIRGQLVCWGGSFQNQKGISINARGIKVSSDVFLIPDKHNEKGEWENFLVNGQMLFDNATIEGDFYLLRCKLSHLSLTGANVLGEFQDDADVYKNDKGNDIDLNIDGFRYQRLDATKERVRDRLAWVGSMSKGDDFYPQPYEQLMKVYREMGHMNWARRVGFELEKKRHKQLRLNRDHKRFVVLGWAWWFWYWILRYTIGYGYKPFRAITRWFAPLFVAGLVLFSGILPCPDLGRAESEACHCMAPSDAEVLLSDDWKIYGKLPKDYPGFNPFYYAVETALPVLPLGQTEHWHPKTPWVRWLQGAITIIGALVLTILASYGVGVLGPRWKDE